MAQLAHEKVVEAGSWQGWMALEWLALWKPGSSPTMWGRAEGWGNGLALACAKAAQVSSTRWQLLQS